LETWHKKTEHNKKLFGAQNKPVNIFKILIINIEVNYNMKTKIKKQTKSNDSIRDVLKPSIQDTMTSVEMTRLKPLAWLIKNQNYSINEIMKTALAFQEDKTAMRAQDILNLIRSRQAEKKKGGKNAKQ
jgi:hypothetical protein